MEKWMPFATEIAHQPIINAIERGDLNGAKRTLKKKIEKSGDSRYLALFCWVQANLSGAADRGEAALRIEYLADAKNKEWITNEDDLEIYEHACEALADGSNGDELSVLIGQIRALAVQNKPKDEQLAVYAMKQCFKEGNYDASLKVAQTLCTNFPKKRNYLFWQIVCRMLLSESPACDGRLRQLNSTMARRMLQTFAKATSDSKDSNLPLKALRNAQEIQLYHQSLVMAGENKELLSALNDPKIGVDSKIIGGDWSMMKTLVETYRVTDSDYATTINLCIRLLTKACANEAGVIEEPMYGDWAVWETYVEAVMGATGSGSFNAQKGYQQGFLDLNYKFRNSKPAFNKTNKRNATLAYVKYMAMLNPTWEGSVWTFRECEHDQTELILKESERKFSKSKPYVVGNLPRRLLYFVEYLHEYGHVPAVYGDLKPYFTQLSQAEREHLLGIAEVVMVERRGWSCDEYGQKGGADETVNFPPLVKTPDQVHAVVNHFKFLYLNTHILYPSVITEEEQEEMGEIENYESIPCRHCRSVDHAEETPKIKFNSRYAWCEHCLTAIIKYGMGVYDHALNGWPEKQWKPFGINPTDCHPGDEAAIMVAMALIKLGGSRSQTAEFFPSNGDQIDPSFALKHGHRRLIQAAALLEFAHKKSPANPQILLLLVKVYTQLGAGSLAMRAYVRLNLKQIQNETLGYILLDRISSTHPHPCDDIRMGDDPVAFDPATELAKLHGNYKRFKEQIERNYWTCLEKGNYGSVFQLVDTHQKLVPSLAGVMSVVERRKILRMRDPDTVFTKSSHGYDILPKDVMKAELADNIDYKSFPSFELSDPNDSNAFIHVAFETGPKPSEARIRAGLLVDELLMLTRSAFDTRSNMTSLILSLKSNFDTYRTQESTTNPLESTAYATPDEYAHTLIALHLIDMVASIGTRDRLSQSAENQISDANLAGVRTALEELKGWTKTNSAAWGHVPDFGSVLHPLYMRWYTVMMVEGVERLVGHTAFQTNGKSTQKFREFVSGPAQDLKGELKQMVEGIRRRMGEGGYMDFIEEVVREGPGDNVDGEDEVPTIGDTLRIVFKAESEKKGEEGRQFVEGFAEDLWMSWQESVVGLRCLI